MNGESGNSGPTLHFPTIPAHANPPVKRRQLFGIEMSIPRERETGNALLRNVL
ncbi:MAG: hypothetical protein HGB15_02925 [Chlorobaculum sp.]|nr:hypothetical protein [Chlorobaculum sp.]